MEERTRGLSRQLRSAEGKIRELQFVEEELNHKLRSLRRENNELRDDLQRDRSRGRAMPTVALPQRSVPYDLAHHNNETRRKVQQVREERGIRSYSAVVQSSGPPPPNMSAVRPAVPPQAKAKMVSQRPPSVSTATPAVSQDSVVPSSNAPVPQLSAVQRGKQRCEDTDDDDDDDDEGTLRRENPDVVASVATSYFGTQWKKWVEMGPNGPGGDAPSNPQLYPQAVEQFLFLDHLMLERKSNALAQFLGGFRSTAQQTRKENRSEAQTKACASWKKPVWATSNFYNRQTQQLERATMAEVRSGAAEKQRQNATRLQKEIEGIAIGRASCRERV